MIEIDKMARELLASELESSGRKGTAAKIRQGRPAMFREELRAIRSALLSAPPGWRLVPVEPTDEMVDAASDAHMPFGDMHFAVTSAILAAPEPK